MRRKSKWIDEGKEAKVAAIVAREAGDTEPSNTTNIGLRNSKAELRRLRMRRLGAWSFNGLMIF